MTNTKVVQMTNNENNKKDYIDPQTAEIIIDQIAALKQRIERAEEQLKLLLIEKSDERAC